MYVTKVNYQLKDGHKTSVEFTNQYGHPMEGFAEFDKFYIRFSAPGTGMTWSSVVFDQKTDEEIEDICVQINEVIFVQ